MKHSMDKIDAEIEENFMQLLANLPETLERELMARVDSFDTMLTPFAQLELLYAQLAQLTPYVEMVAPCHKGCSQCCYYNIPVSTLEVDYIEATTGIKRQQQDLDHRAEPIDYAGNPCPFLKNDLCSIYSARPFACREYYSLANDPKWCAVELGIEMALLQLPPIELLHKKIIAEDADDQLDIRDYFGE